MSDVCSICLMRGKHCEFDDGFKLINHWKKEHPELKDGVDY